MLLLGFVPPPPLWIRHKQLRSATLSKIYSAPNSKKVCHQHSKAKCETANDAEWCSRNGKSSRGSPRAFSSIVWQVQSQGMLSESSSLTSLLPSYSKFADFSIVLAQSLLSFSFLFVSSVGDTQHENRNLGALRKSTLNSKYPPYSCNHRMERRMFWKCETVSSNENHKSRFRICQFKTKSEELSQNCDHLNTF